MNAPFAILVFCWLAVVSIRRDDVKERLPAFIDDNVAGARQRISQFSGLLDALRMGALRTSHLLEWRGRVEIGERAAVVLACDAILEHRQRGATHRAVTAVVE